MTPERSGGEEWRGGRWSRSRIFSSSRLRGTRNGDGRGGGIERSGLHGAEVPGDAGLSRGCLRLPRALAMTNDLFSGREKRNGSEIFYGGGFQREVGFIRADGGEEVEFQGGRLKKRIESCGENVVGILEGGDPVKKNEFVVISAHLDHIGLSAPQADGHNVNNGADDGRIGLDRTAGDRARRMRRGRGEGAAARSGRSSFCGTRAKRKGCGARSISTSFRLST